MATRSKPNWKILDPLVSILEKEGWTHAHIAEDWGMSLATLEAHLTQEVPMSAPPKHDYEALVDEYDLRLTRGDVAAAIQAEFKARGIEPGTFLNQRVKIKKNRREQAVQRPVQPIDTGVDDSAETSADEKLIRSRPPAPVQRPVQRVDTGPVQTLDTGTVQRIDRLEEEVQTLAHAVRSLAERLNHAPVQSPVQITTTPPYPKGKSVRWNLWILEPIRDELATMAAERDVSPSQLVQELLWKALRQE